MGQGKWGAGLKIVSRETWKLKAGCSFYRQPAFVSRETFGFTNLQLLLFENHGGRSQAGQDQPQADP